jgi:hypothetical protein
MFADLTLSMEMLQDGLATLLYRSPFSLGRLGFERERADVVPVWVAFGFGRDH